MIHTDLPIYRTGVQLMQLVSAVKAPPPTPEGIPSMPKPHGVANSVFDLGGTPPPERKSRRRLDPNTIKVERDVPIPARGNGYSTYAAVAERMQVGSMVRLPTHQANGLVSHLKSCDLPHVRRRLAVGMYGVWRTAAWPSDEAEPARATKPSKPAAKGAASRKTRR